MRFTRNIAIALATLAFGAVPAVALAGGHGKSGSPGHNKTTPTTTSTTGTTTTPGASKTAYGKVCQAESKKHVADSKGTPFSQCVVAMADLAKDSKMSASAACTAAHLSHKKIAGSTSNRSPFSECVEAAAKLRSEKA